MRVSHSSKTGLGRYVTSAGARAVVLPPPRRFLSRRAGPGWPGVLMMAISAGGSLGCLALCGAGHPGSGAEVFAAAVLLILGLLLA